MRLSTDAKVTAYAIAGERGSDAAHSTDVYTRLAEHLKLVLNAADGRW
jgi:hypothetical protein